MPTYEYRCESCGYQFEEFQSINDEPVKICPKCTKESVKRLISGGSGLIFKGSGFYITDYKKQKTSGTQNSSSKNSNKESTSGKKDTSPKESSKNK